MADIEWDKEKQAKGIELIQTLGIRPGTLRIDPDGIPTRLFVSENLGESALLNVKLGDVLVKMRVSPQEAARAGDTVPVLFDCST